MQTHAGAIGSASSEPDALAAADAMVAEGRLTDAVDVLAAQHRAAPSPDVQIRLLDLRARAAHELEPGPGREPWPPTYDDPCPGAAGTIPRIGREQLTPEVLGGGIAHHGGIIVERLFDGDQVGRCLDAIERVHQLHIATERSDDREALAWFRPLQAYRKPKDGLLRKFVLDAGGTYLADSPAAAAFVLEDLADAGVIGAVTGHLGERPYFSLQKGTLRRTPADLDYVAWHQDGAFLSEGVRTVNVWIALSPCGGDLPTPGLEIVPRRFDDVLPPDGELIQTSVAPETVRELARDTPTVIPEFAAGDAILFDERLLHRTYRHKGMTDVRYALECWLFAPSHQSINYTPLLV
jgi:hypothetical protein